MTVDRRGGPPAEAPIGLEEFAARLSRAADSLEAGDLRPLGLGATETPAADAPPLDADAFAAPGLPRDRALELDLSAAGLDDKPGKGLGRDAAARSGVHAQASAVLPQAGRSGSFASASLTGVRRSPEPALALHEALIHDKVAATLLCLALGLLLALIPALEGARRDERDRVTPREQELEAVVDRPLAVRAGQARAPGDIVAELELAYDGLRTGFVTTWLAVGLAIGAALAGVLAIRRARMPSASTPR